MWQNTLNTASYFECRAYKPSSQDFSFSFFLINGGASYQYNPSVRNGVKLGGENFNPITASVYTFMMRFQDRKAKPCSDFLRNFAVI
jgi:hypothetical protein